MGMRCLMSTCGLLAALLSVIQASPAAASNFGSGNDGIYLAEDSYPLVARLNLSGAFVAAVDYTSASVYNPTDLSSSVVGNQTNCVDSLGHDVCAFDYTYGATGWLGIYDCIGSFSGAHPDMRCSRGRVRFNLTYPDTAANAESLACHEMGHAVGLRHTYLTSSCLVQDGFPVNWNAHDIAHVNAHY